MENIRGPDWNLIKEEYLKLNGNVKLKEFAEKHGVKYSTLRSRKNRENWDSEINESVATKSATQQKNVATENKTKNNKEEPKLKEVKEVSRNTELTDKQRLFCVYYIKYRNKTKAYMKAYQCSWENANAHAYELWENVGVRKEIEKQLQELYDNMDMSIQDLIQKNIDIINL
ncbi:terminase small subunit [Clostridium sporogenes]